MFYINYQKADGEIIEIADIGFDEQPLIIANQRVYYSDGLTLVSVDYTGNDIRRLKIDIDSGEDITFERIYRTDGEWLYCTGKKCVEIYNDPISLDGFHYVPADFKVKLDFSEYEEIAD